MLTLVGAAPDPTTAVLWFGVVLYAVGVLGIVVPVLPGLLLCVAAVLLWAFGTGGPLAWGTFALVLVLYLVGVGAHECGDLLTIEPRPA